MIDLSRLDERPVLLAIAGSNGAGKSTFYHAHLAAAGLPFLEADHLAAELDLDPYAAAELTNALRRELVRRRESFVFETVLSDPVGNKVAFLEEAGRSGYTVVLCYVGVSGAEVSEQRVAMRVSQGGHDVPSEKLATRFPRTLANLAEALRRLPLVLVLDNDDLAVPFRRVAVVESGRVLERADLVPAWLEPLLAGGERG